MIQTEVDGRQAIAAGADTADGSSATRFAKTIPLLASAAAERDLFPPAASP